MADQALVQTTSPTRWQEPPLAPSLKQTLQEAMDDPRPAYLPVLGPDSIKALRRAADVYEAGLAGASPELITQMFGTLATGFPKQQLSDREADAKLALYIRSLNDIPPDALEHAVAHVLKSQTWFPTVAEIRQAAAPMFEPRRQAGRAIRALILKHDREYQAPVVEKQDWTQAEVTEANQDFRRAGLKTRFRLDPKRPGCIESYIIEPDERDVERNQSAA